MSNNIHCTVEGEASESDDEAITIPNASNNYGIAVDGEASESESEYNSITYEQNIRKTHYKSGSGNNQTTSIDSKYFKGIESDKIWFILTEFKCLIWENMKYILQNNLLNSSKELRNADKMLLKSQMTLQNVSFNLQKSSTNIDKVIKNTENLRTTKFLPSINL